MKIRHLVPMTLSALSLLAVQGLGSPLYEPFDYPSGAALPGQALSPGVEWAAAGPFGPPILIQPGSLNVPGLIPERGNRIAARAVDGPSARLPIGSSVTTET